MMWPRSTPFLALPLLVACSNGSIPSHASQPNCAKGMAKESQKLLSLAEGNAPAALPGGLLVFDKLNMKSYSEEGYSKATFAPDVKCSASFEVHKKAGRYFVRFATTEDCYTGFFRISRNQRMFVNMPGTTQYLGVRPKDERFEKSSRYLKLADEFTPAFRENEFINFGTRAVGTNIVSYLKEVNGKSNADVKKIRESMCFGAAKPTPESCIWPNEMHFDEVEVETPREALPQLEALVLATSEALKASKARLTYTLSPSELDGLFSFSERMATASRMTDKKEAVINIHRFLACDVTGGDANCSGIDRQALDKAGIAIADIYAPDWKVKAQQAAAATTDREDRVSGLFSGAKEEHAESVLKPLFGPAFETYLGLRKKFASNKALFSIATNFVDPNTGSAEALAYKSLPVSAPELAGITLDVDSNGNVLLTHPGKNKNRNLTLDGHMGSVLSFAGIPLLPFDPQSIDQSDATSVMPIPKTSARATTAAEQRPSRESSKTTVGEGKADKGC